MSGERHYHNTRWAKHRLAHMRQGGAGPFKYHPPRKKAPIPTEKKGESTT